MYPVFCQIARPVISTSDIPAFNSSGNSFNLYLLINYTGVNVNPFFNPFLNPW